MQAGEFALMRYAAGYRERWLRDFYQVRKDAVRERVAGEPIALLILPYYYPNSRGNQWQYYGQQNIRSILSRGRVEFFEAGEKFLADGISYPRNTVVLPLAQPYGAFAKTLLESQRYPDLREYPGGPPRRPYDV